MHSQGGVRVAHAVAFAIAQRHRHAELARRHLAQRGVVSHAALAVQVLGFMCSAVALMRCAHEAGAGVKKAAFTAPRNRRGAAAHGPAAGGFRYRCGQARDEQESVHTMKPDGADTIAMDETPWQATHVDDVFRPAVRVQLTWKDVEAAVERGAVVPQQAHALWAGWASPASGLRVGAGGVAPAFETTVMDGREEVLPMPEVQSPLQRHGPGLIVGLVLGLGGAWLTLGG